MNVHIKKKSIRLLYSQWKQQLEPINVRHWSHVIIKLALMNARIVLQASKPHIAPLIWSIFRIRSSNYKLQKCLESKGYQRDPDNCELITACACKDYDECANDSHDCSQGLPFGDDKSFTSRLFSLHKFGYSECNNESRGTSFRMLLSAALWRRS